MINSHKLQDKQNLHKSYMATYLVKIKDHRTVNGVHVAKAKVGPCSCGCPCHGHVKQDQGSNSDWSQTCRVVSVCVLLQVGEREEKKRRGGFLESGGEDRIQLKVGTHLRMKFGRERLQFGRERLCGLCTHSFSIFLSLQNKNGPPL